jgi:hypothetical protein
MPAPGGLLLVLAVAGRAPCSIAVDGAALGPLVDVFGAGIAGEPVREADIPSLLWIPPDAAAASRADGADGNGTLIAVGQVWHSTHDVAPTMHGRQLIQRRSTDVGATWSNWSYPHPALAQPAAKGAKWCCPQQLYDHRTQTAFLLFR